MCTILAFFNCGWKLSKSRLTTHADLTFPGLNSPPFPDMTLSNTPISPVKTDTNSPTTPRKTDRLTDPGKWIIEINFYIDYHKQCKDKILGFS